MTEVKITITGIERVIIAMRKVPDQVEKYFSHAGGDIGRTIIKERGLANYPRATEANNPGRTRTVELGGKMVTFRQGYYERGRGYFAPVRGGGYKLVRGSMTLGKQFYVNNVPGKITISNKADYAPYVIGEEQAGAMAKIGWKKLSDVAKDKIEIITRIYQRWINKMLRDLGL